VLELEFEPGVRLAIEIQQPRFDKQTATRTVPAAQKPFAVPAATADTTVEEDHRALPAAAAAAGSNTDRSNRS